MEDGTQARDFVPSVNASEGYRLNDEQEVRQDSDCRNMAMSIKHTYLYAGTLSTRTWTGHFLSVTPCQAAARQLLAHPVVTREHIRIARE